MSVLHKIFKTNQIVRHHQKQNCTKIDLKSLKMLWKIKTKSYIDFLKHLDALFFRIKWSFSVAHTIYQIFSQFSILGHRQCKFCGKTFDGTKSKRAFDNHSKKHNESRISMDKVKAFTATEFKCQFCNKIYKSNYIKIHQKMSCTKIDLKSLNALKNKEW